MARTNAQKAAASFRTLGVELLPEQSNDVLNHLVAIATTFNSPVMLLTEELVVEVTPETGDIKIKARVERTQGREQ